jgi:type II secretion system protein I
VKARSSISSLRGFTFVEILAALVFLAILVPAVVEGITLASRASEIVERSSIATELAQNKLNELSLNGVWATAGTSGDFGNDWPGYRWEFKQSTWEMDSMTQLDLTVYFNVQGREQNVVLSTLVNPADASTTSTSSSGTSSSK